MTPPRNCPGCGRATDRLVSLCRSCDAVRDEIVRRARSRPRALLPKRDRPWRVRVSIFGSLDVTWDRCESRDAALASAESVFGAFPIIRRAVVGEVIPPRLERLLERAAPPRDKPRPSGDYTTSSEIAAALGVSRQAVWQRGSAERWPREGRSGPPHPNTYPLGQLPEHIRTAVERHREAALDAGPEARRG
ncbi:MAG: hypothetical protein OXJ37_11005 [Bryobacterales bacterium]|nr:hypothetical protein [Bryobacterales bacterium]